MGQELMLNGLTGSLKLEKSGAGTHRPITLPGNKVSQPVETCKVPLNGGAPLAVSSEGRPEGTSRFELAGGECPLRFDILDGAVLVKPLGAAVMHLRGGRLRHDADGPLGTGRRRADPARRRVRGARGGADRAVRDNYKLMSSRLRGPDLRPVVTEQAAFSSDASSSAGPMPARARTASATCALPRPAPWRWPRASASTTATAAPSAAAAAPRPRRKPPVEGMNPEAAARPSASRRKSPALSRGRRSPRASRVRLPLLRNWCAHTCLQRGVEDEVRIGRADQPTIGQDRRSRAGPPASRHCPAPARRSPGRPRPRWRAGCPPWR